MNNPLRNSTTYVDTVNLPTREVQAVMKKQLEVKLTRLPKESFHLGKFDLDEELDKFKAGQMNNLETVAASRGLLIQRSNAKIVLMTMGHKVVRMVNLLEGLETMGRLYLDGKWQQRFKDAVLNRNLHFDEDAKGLHVYSPSGVCLLSLKK